MMELILVGLFSYLIGSIPVAVIVCGLLYRSNPLAGGSGNPGATNVTRLHGLGAGITVFVLDFAKGAGAVSIAWLLPMGDTTEPSVWAVPLALFAVNLGHAASIFLGGRGGKAVASGFGALGVAMPWLALAAILVWLLVFALWRISALAAVTSYALLLPLLLLMASLTTASLPGFPIEISAPQLIGIIALSVLVLVRHRSNYQAIATELRRRRKPAS